MMSHTHQVQLARQGMRWHIHSPSKSPRPGVIMDRDGVLVDFVDYLHHPEETRLAFGAAQLILAMRKAGVAVGVATNQAGIARSLYTWNDYLAVEAEIDRQLTALGAQLDGIVACPYHPDFTKEWSQEYSYWRKPGPGMLELLMAELNIFPKCCWVIGDHLSDIGAAKAAGLTGAILLKRGRGFEHQAAARALASTSFEVAVLDDLAAALPLLCKHLGLSLSGNE